MNKKIENLLAACGTVAVVDLYFGDSGKGSVGDKLGDWADMTVRGNGGANAGHTIKVDGKTYVLHLIPSGILHPGKINVLGSGMAIDPGALIKEMTDLKKAGVAISETNLKIALKAHVVLPHHIFFDRLLQKSTVGIGTTGRGIGQTYTDHVARVGLTMTDLQNPDVLRQKLRRCLQYHDGLLSVTSPQLVRQILEQPDLGGGRFYSALHGLDIGAIVEAYAEYGTMLQDMICDTDELVRNYERAKKKIVLEGAQGFMLSLNHGTYPYVTSSDCSLDGLARGAGLDIHSVDYTFVVSKAFHMTRVGDGPFPTEMGGSVSAEWCRTATRETEDQPFASNFNPPDEFVRGVKLRKLANEYGSTTGRARRVGHIDLPLLDYFATRHKNCRLGLFLTKLDISDGQPIQICNEYKYTGPFRRVGQTRYDNGVSIATAVPEVLEHCQPEYVTHDPWDGQITNAESLSDLPKEAQEIIQSICDSGGIPFCGGSFGAGRDQYFIE